MQRYHNIKKIKTESKNATQLNRNVAKSRKTTTFPGVALLCFAKLLKCVVAETFEMSCLCRIMLLSRCKNWLWWWPKKIILVVNNEVLMVVGRWWDFSIDKWCRSVELVVGEFTSWRLGWILWHGGYGVWCR